MKAAVRIMFWIALLFTSSSFVEQGRWLITPKSRLSIHGSTNINTFKCLLDSYSVSDTLEYTREKKSIEMTVTKNKMRIPIRGFDCGNRQITKDFQETLKYEKFPELEISFKSFTSASIADKSTVDGIVDITLAGNTKRYKIKYFARVPSDEKIMLTGTQLVNFSDFKLIPPKKMMGMIQVQECLEVEFDLMLEKI